MEANKLPTKYRNVTKQESMKARKHESKQDIARTIVSMEARTQATKGQKATKVRKQGGKQANSQVETRKQQITARKCAANKAGK